MQPGSWATRWCLLGATVVGAGLASRVQTRNQRGVNGELSPTPKRQAARNDPDAPVIRTARNEVEVMEQCVGGHGRSSRAANPSSCTLEGRVPGTQETRPGTLHDGPHRDQEGDGSDTQPHPSASAAQQQREPQT